MWPYIVNIIGIREQYLQNEYDKIIPFNDFYAVMNSKCDSNSHASCLAIFVLKCIEMI